ncbi:MAG: PDZ domain-containing protein [Dehalococcoidia bacterium]
MNATKITAGALVALTGVALTAVVAANPFSTQANSIQAPEPVQPQAVEHLQVVEDEDADSDAQTKPHIGVAISPLSPARAEELGVDGGVMVTAVLNESPSSGVLEQGDVITSIYGQIVSSPKDVMDAVMASSVGDVISVIVIRGDDTLDLSVTVGETDISKRGIFRSRVTQMHQPDVTKRLIQQVFRAGDRFARGEVVMADENGVYQTYRATAGLVTEIDADAGTFTLQPKDGSALIEYMISDDTKINLNRAGDLGELNTEDNTLVVDVNGEVKLVHQGEMPLPHMHGKGHGPNIQMHRGQGGQEGRIGPGGQGFGNFNQSGLLDQIRDRLPFFGANGGPGDLSDFLSPEVLERIEQFGRGELDRSDFLSEICESLDQENLPNRIIIRCETSDEAPATPAVDDNSL